jgi:2-succinyl-5-enolpyruvyl-6-hydroxy-3-cyclohexene-1-carboxylate synthase
MTPENVLPEWSRLLVESLADAGLRDAIVSPGSRSTPLAWALLSCSRIRCRSIVDERSAAFFALGQGRATGFPALVLCTSGSAAANYFPAIVEASLSRTPLVVVTADRPFELLDASASQTIDQTKIYGDYVRRFVDLGMPDPAETALVALRRKAAQTISDSLGPDPGPVHLNFRARKPLEPVEGKSSTAAILTAAVDAALARGITAITAPRRGPAKGSVELIARECRTAERGVIVCGPATFTGGERPSLVDRLSALTGFPVYAEATSQARFGLGADVEPSLALDALGVLLGAPAFRDAFTPDLVLQIGEPPVSGAWDRFVGSRPTLPRHVIAPYGWPDPHGTARSLVVADVDETLSELIDASNEAPTSRTAAWITHLARANEAAWRVVDSVLAGSGLSEGAAVRAVVDALPEGAALALGNSLPVRHVDSFVRRGKRGLSVLCQRGASGIDGVVSAAAGAATATGRPTALLIGDVSALHDLGGFAAASLVEVPLVVVVLNNDGGRIFEQLPLSSMDIGEERMRFWTTPHGGHFDGLADMFRLRYERPASIEHVQQAVTRAIAEPGCSVLELKVPPHGVREQAVEIAARLGRELAPFGTE